MAGYRPFSALLAPCVAGWCGLARALGCAAGDISSRYFWLTLCVVAGIRLRHLLAKSKAHTETAKGHTEGEVPCGAFSSLLVSRDLRLPDTTHATLASSI